MVAYGDCEVSQGETLQDEKAMCAYSAQGLPRLIVRLLLPCIAIGRSSNKSAGLNRLVGYC